LGAAKISLPWRLFFAIVITIALAYPRHKVYEQALSLLLVSALYFVLVAPSSIKRWFFFGVVTGIAAVFGRNHGVFFVVSALLMVIYLLISREYKCAYSTLGSYFSGIAFGYIPVIYFFVIDQHFRAEFIKSVLSTLDWQLPLPIPFFWRGDYSSGLGFEAFHTLTIGIACVLVPAIYFVGLVCLFKSPAYQKSKSQMLLLLGASSLAGIPYLHQAFDRADFGHIAQSTLPVFIAIAAIVSMFSKDWRKRLLLYIFCTLSLIVLLGAWFTSLPVTRSLRAESLYPDSIVSHEIGGRDFLISRYQANVLTEVERISKKCRVSDNEFLALPHFPGVYAYLGVRAPFWEMYYLYPRSAKFQRRHIDSISSVKVILIAPDATVDGLERLKLKNTYGNLLNYIQSNYLKLDSPILPNGIFIYVHPKACGD
jgi:hypothetical protein